MIRKFATISGGRIVQWGVLITILAGVATVHAQQTSPDPQTAPPSQTQQQQTQQPAQQQPAQTQQPQGEQEQEATPEESVPIHRVKPKLYKNWVYNVGAGASVTGGTTKTYVRSGGLVGAMGTPGGPLATHTVSSSSSAASVSGTGNVGGLVGHLEWGSTITGSFAAVATSGSKLAFICSNQFLIDAQSLGK